VSAAAGRERTPEELDRALADIWSNPGGVRRLTVVNHTIIGKRFLVTSLIFFLIGGALAMLIRAQLATADNAFLSHEAYNQVFTMHGTIMMFLFAIPAIEGFSLYLIPKLLGARDLAFPRLSAFGYFCYLFGGSMLLVSLVLGLAPRSGWFMYTPLSSKPFSPGMNDDFWLLGVTFVEISAVAIGVELAATILKVRAAGMALHRMPLFGWYMLVVGVMIVLGFPPLILASILLEIERAFDWPFFEAARGGDPLLWQHLFWLFGHPEVYIIFVPAAGLVSMMIPALARHTFVGYTAVVVSVIAIGFVSFGLWVHHMYAVGIPHLALTFFSAASMLVAIPTAVQFFAWIATLWSGRPMLEVPLLYLFGFLVIFVFGGLTGVMLALVPFDWQVHDTHFVVAHFHYVLVGGFVFPLLAAAYYWMPHLTGRMPSRGLGTVAFWLIFLGFNLTFFIMHFTGLRGMTRRIYTYQSEFGWDLFNLVSSIGGFVMSAGVMLVIVDFLLHARHGERAERSPWKAGTLEWAQPNPPPVYNFASLPEVGHREPVWDNPKLPEEMAEGRHFLAIPRNGWQETLGVDAVSGRPDYIIILPGPHWAPFLGAASLAVFFVSFLLEYYAFAPVGLALALVVFLWWAWSTGLPEDPEPLPAGRGLSLMPHAAADGAPGWWGTWFMLVANGTLFASLMFGYIFLATMAPNWPPPALVEPQLGVLAAILVGVLAGAGTAQRAVAMNTDAGPAAAMPWLIAGLVAGVLAAAGFAAVPLTGMVSPTEHAYDATVAALAGYGALHSGLAAVICGHVLARSWAGYVSPLRSLDLRVARLWWGYTALTGLLITVAIFGLPLVAPS
jgi:cytochrome c oxidase subunit I+III